MDAFGFDIETDTSINGLDPAVAEIVSLAAWSPTWELYLDGGSEADRLGEFLDALQARPAGIAITWNGSVFDIPFILDRATMLGIDTGWSVRPDADIQPKYDPLPGHAGGYRAVLGKHAHVDVAYQYRDWALNHPDLGRKGWSLKPVAQARGISMVHVDREQIHQLTHEQLRDYNLSDAHGTYELGMQLPDLATLVDRI